MRFSSWQVRSQEGGLSTIHGGLLAVTVFVVPSFRSRRFRTGFASKGRRSRHQDAESAG